MSAKSVCAVLGFLCLLQGLPYAAGIAQNASPSASAEADQLYRQREDLTKARQAATIWAAESARSFESAWKLARVSYWIGNHAPESERRAALEQGIAAGQLAATISPSRPEGHFWTAANMGALAESSSVQGLKYRGKIRDELERSISVGPGFDGGVADAALGQWYFDVPRLFGGSRSKAEEHLRRALSYDADGRLALSVLADVLIADGRQTEARVVLQRLIDAPPEPDWMPEDLEFQKKAAERLKTLKK